MNHDRIRQPRAGKLARFLLLLVAALGALGCSGRLSGGTSQDKSTNDYPIVEAKTFFTQQ